MKVSVCMITYNHEKYIEQAVTSALSQETNFDFEIVIGEDCSTDQTCEILRELQRQYPNRIRLLAQPHNIGGQRNFVKTLSACKGQLVACLEGDDFWTSTHKLQMLVDFLDAHPECAMCFHRAEILYEQEPGRHVLLPADDFAEVSSMEVLLGASNPIATCTVMFRNHLFDEFPDWFYQLRLGDWPLHIFNAQHGMIGYLPDVMASYRVHSAGGWSSLRPDQGILAVLDMLQHLNAHLNFKYNAAIDRTIGELLDNLAWYLIQKAMTESSEQHPFNPLELQHSDLIRRLFRVVLAKSAALNQGKSWLESQYINWQAETERRTEHIARQQDWITELERAKIWLEEQRANWQAEAERRGDQLAKLEEHHAKLQQLYLTLQSLLSEWEQSRWVSIGKRLGILSRFEAPPSSDVG